MGEEQCVAASERSLGQWLDKCGPDAGQESWTTTVTGARMPSGDWLQPPQLDSALQSLFALASSMYTAGVFFQASYATTITVLWSLIIYPSPSYKQECLQHARKGVSYGEMQAFSHLTLFPLAVCDVVLFGGAGRWGGEDVTVSAVSRASAPSWLRADLLIAVASALYSLLVQLHAARQSGEGVYEQIHKVGFWRGYCPAFLTSIVLGYCFGSFFQSLAIVVGDG